MKNGVTVKDNSLLVVTSVKALLSQRVLVGFPSGGVPRTDTPLNDATIGYIHNYGAPEASIPQREFMGPGIQNKKTEIVNALKFAGKAALKGDDAGVQQGLGVAGAQGVIGIKDKITTGPFQPLAQSTIDKRRRRSTGSSYRRKAAGATDTTPLYDTGAMLDAVNYVVRKVKGWLR